MATDPPPATRFWHALRPLILGRLRRWRIPPHFSHRDWFDEAEAEARLAFVLAIRDFDPARGVPLGAFCYRRCVTAIRTFHRREWSYGRRHHGLPEGSEPRDATARPSIEQRGPGDVEDALSTLGPSERRVLSAIFLEGRTEAELAALEGVSQQAVSKRKRLALNRLQKKLQ
jgi:RNA polymerase sigma factor (sigma-70 family)